MPSVRSSQEPPASHKTNTDTHVLTVDVTKCAHSLATQHTTFFIDRHLKGNPGFAAVGGTYNFTFSRTQRVPV